MAKEKVTTVFNKNHIIIMKYENTKNPIIDKYHNSLGSDIDNYVVKTISWGKGYLTA